MKKYLLISDLVIKLDRGQQLWWTVILKGHVQCGVCAIMTCSFALSSLIFSPRVPWSLFPIFPLYFCAHLTVVTINDISYYSCYGWRKWHPHWTQFLHSHIHKYINFDVNIPSLCLYMISIHLWLSLLAKWWMCLFIRAMSDSIVFICVDCMLCQMSKRAQVETMN